MHSHHFHQLACPFYEGDSWMMAMIIADLRRGKIPHEVRLMPDGSKEIWRSLEGWREVIEIEAEVQDVDQCSLLDLDDQEVLP